MNSPEIAKYIQILKDEDHRVRASAVSALVKVGVPAVPALIEFWSSYHYVGRNVAYVLGEIGSASAIPALIKALEDSDKRVRRNAVSALGKIGVPAVPALIVALKNRDHCTLCHANEALIKIGVPAIPALIEALKDHDQFVRFNAAEALGSIGDASAVPALSKALRDREE